MCWTTFKDTWIHWRSRHLDIFWTSSSNHTYTYYKDVSFQNPAYRWMLKSCSSACFNLSVVTTTTSTKLTECLTKLTKIKIFKRTISKFKETSSWTSQFCSIHLGRDSKSISANSRCNCRARRSCSTLFTKRNTRIESYNIFLTRGAF